ncbi:beta-glucosidase BglX [Prolixibacter denitrificans]|uniref:beta-glucosidase n=1 Tax=Prolixibacter denitrificans TaxID=1541063 RepID=A0A2P8CKR2_9BACT|nr:beta-glucosidase BglX [Prolixibacter denitrificans]PSK85541.1 beta-glucosidase [Prolixibacter denitrificans]GET20161.1 glycosyl hydrolase [Prolixibacter denitrificans]
MKWSAILLLVFLTLGNNLYALKPKANDEAIEKKVNDLLKKMTLDEKIGQLNQYTSQWEMTGPAPQGASAQHQLQEIKSGAVGSMLNVVGAEATRKTQELAVKNSRLHIPLIFGYDVIHGFKTMFPIPLGEAASWEPELAKLSAHVAAVEASASGLQWTFAPMMDISRDARWGRVMEGSGEDPYLGAKFAAARVHGFQGDDLSSDNTVAACAKHFAAYGFVESGRDYNTVDISEHTLRNTVLPPFEAAVKAGVATVMNSFNEIGGTPATASAHLQRDILKGQWGFKGFVVSDWNSIGELIPHGVAANKAEAAELAIKAGSDMDMEGHCYITSLKKLVEEGKVDESLIDDAVRRILRVKFELGLFDDPYKYSNENREKTEILTPEHLAAARKVARHSIVLLKNDEHLLPLKKEGQTIAVIGPLAADKDSPLGSWRAQAITGSAVSLLEGVKGAVADPNKILYAEGAPLTIGQPSFTKELKFNTTDSSGFGAARQIAKKADVVVLAVGENCFQTGEGRSQTEIRMKGLQEQLMKAVYAANPNVVVVLTNGRPLVIDWMAEHVPAIVEAWHLGSEAGNAIADVLFGDYNPSGKLPVSFPRAVGQLPIYYNHKSTGRPDPTGTVFWSHYTDQKKTPLFPFGYGLSYTTFKYSPVELSSHEMSMNGKLDVSVNVQNTGKVAGEEVVQLYIRDLVGSVSRPVKELKGFRKISLKPGESQKVTFTLTPDDLAFYGADLKKKAEPGEFKVFVGTNSDDVQENSFVLK